MIILKIVFAILLLGYSSIIIYFLFKWNDIPFFKANCKSFHTTLSVIVPFRNEGKNIGKLIDNLLNQDYPALLYEIILVNDFSTDNSLQEIKVKVQEAKNKNINVKVVDSTRENKKNAITQGVEIAAGELIVTTDADCSMRKTWLKTIVCYYQYFNFDAASAPVIFNDTNNLWKKLQQLEFISLVSTGAASVVAGIPVMCNGANLAYKKSSFNAVNGYEAVQKTPSGDDVLLFQKLAADKKFKLTFIKAEEAIVKTLPSETIRDFIAQRKRWASKVNGQFYFPSFIIAAIVYLFSLSIVITGISAFFSKEFFNIFIFMFSIKFFVDYMFFASVLKFFKEKILLFLILPAEILYVFYVVAVGTIAPFGSYKWKDRSHR